jgi:hypothetical protein
MLELSQRGGNSEPAYSRIKIIAKFMTCSSILQAFYSVWRNVANTVYRIFLEQLRIVRSVKRFLAFEERECSSPVSHKLGGDQYI